MQTEPLRITSRQFSDRFMGLHTSYLHLSPQIDVVLAVPHADVGGGIMTHPMKHTVFVLLLLASTTVPIQAQGPWAGSLTAGWSGTGGYSLYWNDGAILTIRGSVWRRVGSRLDLGVDGAWHHFGQDVESFGGEETLTIVAKPTAWDASVALRWRVSDQGGVRPRATFGLGVIKRRARLEETSRLPDGTVTSGPTEFTSSPGIEPLATLGAGIEVGPPEGHLALMLGGRLGISLHDPFDDGAGWASLISLIGGVAVH